jgi:O-succinylbenzoic acid--CoA ligase
VPDARWGQRVVAVVTPRGDRVVGVRELREWCRDRLPAAALPREVKVVAAMPTLPAGKPDRAAIARIAAG